MPGIVPSLPAGPPAGAAEPPAQRSNPVQGVQGPANTEETSYTAPDIGLHADDTSGSEKHQQASGCDASVESPAAVSGAAEGDELPVGAGVKDTPFGAEPNDFLTLSTTMSKSKPKKRSKKKLSTEQRGPTALPPSRGTGTEEFYADPPITPDEYKEERDLYSLSRPFHERIEECLQRFRARRRLTSAQTALFNRYLLLGGIDTSPRMFTGTAGIDMKGALGSEVRAMTANDGVSRGHSGKGRFYNPAYPEHWDVDFSGVVAGFLSWNLPLFVGGYNDDLKHGILVVDNFLRYVSRHDVCPEYQANVDEARAYCLKASVELPVFFELASVLPGDFNRACRVLFCPKEEEEDDDALFDLALAEKRQRGFDPARVFKTVIALHADPGSQATTMARNLDTIKVTKTREMDIEVTRILPPSETMIKIYRGLKARDGKQGVIEPVGSAVFKHINIRDGWDRIELSDEELSAQGEETFFFEKSILGLMDIKIQLANEPTTDGKRDLLALLDLDQGFKLRVKVCELNCGIKFIKEVVNVYPTFYTYLPQELMIHYKEPVPNEREAPSVENPDAELMAEAESLSKEEAD